LTFAELDSAYSDPTLLYPNFWFVFEIFQFLD